MLHSTVEWENSTRQLASQYRSLADWIEEKDVVPWHVDVNWSNDELIIHLREETFFRLFQGYQTIQRSDAQGTTWNINSLNLNFTCFVPHPFSQDSMESA